MSNFEDQLRAALQRQEPPRGFADRVLERTGRESADRLAPARRPRRMWAPVWGQLWWGPLWRIGAIAATLTVVSFSVTTYQHTREERAARQAELALRIAAEKLNLARDHVLRNLALPKDN